MTASADRAPPGNGIARLLRSFAQGDPEEVLALDRLLYGLGRSAFGMFLFVSVLPGFVPIPGFAGVVSGPLVALIGLQLIVGLRKPWVPGFIGRRGPRRSTMARFCDRISPAMARLEHLVRPRLRALTRSRASRPPRTRASGGDKRGASLMPDQSEAGAIASGMEPVRPISPVAGYQGGK